MTDDFESELVFESGRRAAEIDLITSLLSAGVHPQTIASSTKIPLTQITQVLNVHLSGRVPTPEDDELAAQARDFARRVMTWATEMLDVAPLPVQVQIAKSVMPAIGRMVGSSQGQSFEEAHQAFQQLLASQRQGLNGPAPFTLPTDDSD